jgi:hypothetical protein
MNEFPPKDFSSRKGKNIELNYSGDIALQEDVENQINSSVKQLKFHVINEFGDEDKFFDKIRGEIIDEDEEEPIEAIEEDGTFLKLIYCVEKMCPKMEVLMFLFGGPNFEWGEEEFLKAVSSCEEALKDYKSKFEIKVRLFVLT